MRRCDGQALLEALEGLLDVADGFGVIAGGGGHVCKAVVDQALLVEGGGDYASLPSLRASASASWLRARAVA